MLRGSGRTKKWSHNSPANIPRHQSAGLNWSITGLRTTQPAHVDLRFRLRVWPRAGQSGAWSRERATVAGWNAVMSALAPHGRACGCGGPQDKVWALVEDAPQQDLQFPARLHAEFCE